MTRGSRRRGSSASLVESPTSPRRGSSQRILSELERTPRWSRADLDFSEYVALVRSSAEFRRNIRSSIFQANAELEELGKREAKFRTQIDLTDIVLGRIPHWLLRPKARPPRPAYMQLSASERAWVESQLVGGSSLLVERSNIQIFGDTLLCLREKEWLNDEVINFYFDLLNSERVFCWNSFFWLKLSGDGKGYNYKAVQRWTSRRKIEIFKFERILVPMNIGKNHWALGLIDLKKKHISYLDSLAPNTVHASFAEFMLRYLEDEHRDKGVLGSFDFSEFTTPLVAPPQQQNSHDCGVFTCLAAECLANFRDWLDFDQSMIPDMRKKIAVQILRNHIGAE